MQVFYLHCSRILESAGFRLNPVISTGAYGRHHRSLPCLSVPAPGAPDIPKPWFGTIGVASNRARD
jgi:hypothetical protein